MSLATKTLPILGEVDLQVHYQTLREQGFFTKVYPYILIFIKRYYSN